MKEENVKVHMIVLIASSVCSLDFISVTLWQITSVPVLSDGLMVSERWDSVF